MLSWERRVPTTPLGMLAEQHRVRFLSATETEALGRAWDLEPGRGVGADSAAPDRRARAGRAAGEMHPYRRGGGVLTVVSSRRDRSQHVPLSLTAERVLEG